MFIIGMVFGAALGFVIGVIWANHDWIRVARTGVPMRMIGGDSYSVRADQTKEPS